MSPTARSEGREQSSQADFTDIPDIRSFSNSSKIKVFIKQKSYIALLDTGADISCISADLAQNLINQKVVKLQPCALAMIRGVGGQTTSP